MHTNTDRTGAIHSGEDVNKRKDAAFNLTAQKQLYAHHMLQQGHSYLPCDCVSYMLKDLLQMSVTLINSAQTGQLISPVIYSRVKSDSSHFLHIFHLEETYNI
jgi:hypothetical protein